MLRLLLATLLCTAFCLEGASPALAKGDRLRVRFVPTLNGRPVEIYEGGAADSLRITAFRCYVSGIALSRGKKLLARDPERAHLLDAALPESLLLSLPQGEGYDTLSFNLGVDSLTSCSGALGGDLDPAKGMYWAWQSGYINMKFEGISPECAARKHAFQFHLGGYAAPYAAIQRVSMAVVPAGEIIVRIELSKFLTAVDLKAEHALMIPGQRAQALSHIAAGMFQTK